MGSMTEPLLTGVAPEATPLPSAKVVAISIVRAFSVYGLANLGIRALNFLLLPIYTRFLTPADYGVMVLAETLAAFLVSIVSLGFDASIQRLYFRHVDDSRALSAYVGSVLKFALLLEIAFLALAFAVGPRLHHALAPAANVPFLYIAMALATAVATQFFGYRLVLYQAERRPWGYAILWACRLG